MTKIMGKTSSGSIADEDLELVDWDMVFRMLLSPHGQGMQGMIAVGWKLAQKDIDDCQCALELATRHMQLDLSTTQTSQQGE